MKASAEKRVEESRDARRDGVPGIVIAAGSARGSGIRPPRISAFVWGGKTRPSPTLPYGRWKGLA